MAKKRAHETVLEQMQAKIVSGEWKPGERLPTLHDLAHAFSHSMTAVREALRILESRRIVSIEHGRGVFVRGDPDLFEDPAGRLHGEDGSTLLELLEARAVIEPELAALCAERAAPSLAERLRQLAEQMDEEMRKGADHFATDLQFHETIAEGAGNPLLARMLSVIADLSAEGRRQTDRLPHMKRKAASYHHLIAIAMVERRADDVRSLMHSHILDMMAAVKQKQSNPSQGEIRQ